MNESPEIGEITAVNSLALTAPTPLTEHPAAVYLSNLSAGSRAAMRQSLNAIPTERFAIAKILTSNECDALTLNWAEVRYKHTALLRCILMERYAPATANKMLSALRRVLKEALRLELMDARDFARAVDIPNIKRFNYNDFHEKTGEEFIGVTSMLHEAQVWKKKEQAKQSIEKYSDFLLEKVEAGSQVRVDIKQLKRSSDGKLTDELVESLLFLPEKN